MIIDNKVETYFDKRIKQVFVYITSRCQLHCKQCLYKPLLCPNSSDIDFNQLITLLETFRKWGAYKLSFLGGEPTLYHDKVNNKRLSDVILCAKQIGYKYIRIDTNGQFDESFLNDDGIKQLSEITFSIDGHDQETNDAVRGIGSYQKCIANLKTAVELGYNVQITSCVHKYSCPNAEIGLKNLKAMISFAQKLGVKSINFHPILKVGIARDNWIDSTDISVSDWKTIYNQMLSILPWDNDSIKVRIPMRFADCSLVAQNKEKYHYCPVDMGERALIMPDGQIKVCAFTIGTQECVARYDMNGIFFEEKENETRKIGTLEGNQVCYNQIGNYENNVPLCMSYKPYQTEMVWKEIRNDRDNDC